MKNFPLSSSRLIPHIIFIISISFLLIRNIPLCFLLPIWAHGDEIGHLDYVLKLSRGHIPQSYDYIEPSLFLFHKAHWDSRIIASGGEFRVKKIQEMGLAAYSYEAHHPPLPYFILALCRRLFFLKSQPLLLQISILRLLCLFSVAIGMTVIYLALRRHNIYDLLFYFPFLFISLLAQDMFAAINTDNFSFFCGAIACAGLIYIGSDPINPRRWFFLFIGTVLGLWTKISNIYLFTLWAIPLYIYRKSPQRKSIFSIIFITLILAFTLSLPWYIYNFIRFSNPIVDPSVQYPLVPPQGFSLNSLKIFFLAFSRTLFRGEFIWEGHYLDIIHGRFNPLFFGLLPAFIFLVGLYQLSSKHMLDAPISLLFGILLPPLVFMAYFLIYCFKGGFPLYHARLSFGELYFIMLLYVSGWKIILRSTLLAGITAAIMLFAYNLIYTINLVSLIY